jgi:hypothetical protein
VQAAHVTARHGPALPPVTHSPPSRLAALFPCSFPAAHVLMRLEHAAAGTWPAHTGAAQDSGRLLRAMVCACSVAMQCCAAPDAPWMGTRLNPSTSS